MTTHLISENSPLWWQKCNVPNFSF